VCWTSSRMICIKNGDRNPLLRWSPFGCCAWFLSSFLGWVSLRSKLQSLQHAHIHICLHACDTFWI
jgi:hypothetical protein